MQNRVRGPNGGFRPGAGRPPGSKSKHVIQRELMAQRGLAEVADGGLLPLTVMLCRMRGEPLPDGTPITDEMFQAAVAAAPFVHPRLAATEATIRSDNVHRVLSDEPLTPEQWLERYGPPANDGADGERSVAD
jgi:hypothetical protein